MRKANITSKGFTIVELVMVIAVIGILAAITIVAYNGIQENAKVARANEELSEIADAIKIARVRTNQTLYQITGYGCTCGNKVRTDAAIDKISVASGVDLSELKRGDPWGSPYYIDENEGEIATNLCRQDSLRILPAHDGVTNIVLPMHRC